MKKTAFFLRQLRKKTMQHAGDEFPPHCRKKYGPKKVCSFLSRNCRPQNREEIASLFFCATVARKKVRICFPFLLPESKQIRNGFRIGGCLIWV